MLYVWRLEELQHEVSTAVLAAVLARSMGSEVDVPDWPTVRAEYDEWLASEPVREDPNRGVLMRAYGLRR